MDDLYRELILDYFRHPRNFGELTQKTHSFEMSNPLCGDRIRMDVKVQGIKGSRDQKIADIKFSGSGCAISMAASSMLTELVKEKKITYLHGLKKDDIVKLLGVSLTPVRLKCALLGLEVLQKAVRVEKK